MLSQTTEDKQLTFVPATCPKSKGPFHRNLEKTPWTNEEAGQTAPPVASYQADTTSYLLYLGPLSTWPETQDWQFFFSVASPYRGNPWDTEFTPKDFPTTHKIPSTLPKRWELHEDYSLMLKPRTSTAVD